MTFDFLPHRGGGTRIVYRRLSDPTVEGGYGQMGREQQITPCDRVRYERSGRKKTTAKNDSDVRATATLQLSNPAVVNCRNQQLCFFFEALEDHERIEK